MSAYCDWQSVDFNSIAFLFDGRCLRAKQTLDQVVFPSSFFMDSTSQLFSFWFWLELLFLQMEMEDGDEIDAMLHQTGGGFVLWVYLSSSIDVTELRNIFL